MSIYFKYNRICLSNCAQVFFGSCFIVTTYIVVTTHPPFQELRISPSTLVLPNRILYFGTATSYSSTITTFGHFRFYFDICRRRVFQNSPTRSPSQQGSPTYKSIYKYNATLRAVCTYITRMNQKKFHLGGSDFFNEILEFLIPKP